jgi:hypothetical protein
MPMARPQHLKLAMLAHRVSGVLEDLGAQLNEIFVRQVVFRIVRPPTADTETCLRCPGANVIDGWQ